MGWDTLYVPRTGGLCIYYKNCLTSCILTSFFYSFLFILRWNSNYWLDINTFIVLQNRAHRSEISCGAFYRELLNKKELYPEGCIGNRKENVMDKIWFRLRERYLVCYLKRWLCTYFKYCLASCTTILLFSLLKTSGYNSNYCLDQHLHYISTSTLYINIYISSTVGQHMGLKLAAASFSGTTQQKRCVPWRLHRESEGKNYGQNPVSTSRGPCVWTEMMGCVYCKYCWACCILP